MAGQVIQGTGNAANIGGVDDFYLIVAAPNAIQLPQAPTAIVGAVGSAQWGPLNTAVTIGSGQDVQSTFGASTIAPYDLVTDLLLTLGSGCNNVRAVRVSDGTDIATLVKMLDATGFATGTLTVASAFSTSTVFSITLTPTSGPPVVVTYTPVAGDTNITGVAASIVNAINATSSVQGPNAFLQKATSAVGAITFTALVQGTAGNSISTTASVTGGTMTITPTILTVFTGGATPGTILTLTSKYTGSLPNGMTARIDPGSNTTTASPTYKMTLTFPSAAGPEIYDNIVAYTTVGGGYVAASFMTNLANAVNATPQLSASRPGSAYWIATAGASSTTPVLGSVVPVMPIATSGIDGSVFGSGATFAQLGNDALTPKTGMYALSGLINGGQFFLCGNADISNASAAQTAFALRENAAAFIAYPTGTSSTSAIALRQSLGLASPNVILFKDFHEFTDTVNNINGRRVAPLAMNAAKNALQSPETSPANQRMNSFITGTERFSTLPGILPSPYSNAELALLEAAGINVNTPQGPGVNAFCIRHNKNSMGSADPRGNIAYTNMSKFLIASLQPFGGQFVGLAQSTAPNDPVRAKLRNALTNFVVNLINQGLLDPASKDGVVCDLRNNPKASIALGILRFDITLVYLSVIDKVVGLFSGGQTNVIRIVPQGTTANT